MLSLVEQIRHGRIWDFPGGIHPPENKSQSTKNKISHASIPSELIIPLKQHIGRSGELVVKVGDSVLKGQQLTQFTASFMLPVHAPTSGVIAAIEPRVMTHPSGLEELSLVLKPDGRDKWIEKQTLVNFKESTPDELIEIIRQAGISGMGGAGFPTARKIQSGIAKTEILIINAAECEPYITADDMLLREHAAEFIQGVEIISQILKPKLVIIGIEDNKPEAIKALESAAVSLDIVIRAIPTKYPSGGEKQLIKLLTNKEVPKGGIPADIGVLMQNVGSVFAIKRAVVDGEPLIERLVTLTGKTFPQPRNVWVRIGTPVHALLDEFGYKPEKKNNRIIMGGPMMGFTIPSVDVPIVKTSNCVLAPKIKEIPTTQHSIECIRCGQCAEVCPASLLPQQLYWYSKDKDHNKCEELNISDCIECGACAYVCPSEIPLVQYYRQAKAEIRITKDEIKASERAKQRFEQKQLRLEKDKAERENRFKKAAEDRRKEASQSDEKDAIAAAIARVKSKSSDEKKDSAAKPAIAAAIARAKEKRAQAALSEQQIPDNSEMAKLREERKRQARERKALREASDTNHASLTDDVSSTVEPKVQHEAVSNQNQEQDKKKAAIAAAIARAKAKKAKLAESNDEEQPSVSSSAVTETEAEATPNPEQEQDKKKAAVAAAIARAKAKKAKLAESNNEEQPSVTSSTVTETEAEAAPKPEQEQDKKKAAVAAAIARAKAKKAQRETQQNQSKENN